MFGFLKKKLNSAISKFSKKIEETEDEKAIEELEEPIEDIKKEQIKIEDRVKKEIKTQSKLKKEPKKILSDSCSKESTKEKIEYIQDEVEEKETEILEQTKKIIKEEQRLEKESKKEQVSNEESKIPGTPECVEKEIQDVIKETEEIELEQEKIKLEKKLDQVEEKKSFLNIFKKKKIEEKPRDIIQENPKIKEKKGIFSRVTTQITTKKIDESKFEELFWDLELALLENNVAVEVIEKIKKDLKDILVGKPLTRTKIFETINKTLKNSIKDILEIDKIDFLKTIKKKKPYVICFVGINGSGKTTSIAKVAKLLQNNKISCVMAAADTFRAAAIDQIQYHADKLGIKLIKQDYGSDPAAVAFDAIKHAEAKHIDVVLIDTAGRMHSNQNLQDEMKKIIRVAKPDMKIFVGESITGNDCTEQAKQFNESIDIDGIILSKQDIDEKGGAALSVSYITKKPILYIGTGQEYDDLEEFNFNIILDNLGL
jgi:fused signal recognition particle receptor